MKCNHYRLSFILFLVCSLVPPILAYLLFLQGKSPWVMVAPWCLALWLCIQSFTRWRQAKKNEHSYMLKLIQFSSNHQNKF